MKDLVDSTQVIKESVWYSEPFSCVVDSYDKVSFEADIEGLTIITEDITRSTTVICLDLEDSKALVEAFNKVSGLLWRE